MKKFRFTTCVPLLMLLAAGVARPVPADAQGAEEQPPRYTTEEIIERLDIAPPPEVRTRGLRPGEGATPARAEAAEQPVGRIDDFRVLFAFDSAELTPEAREDLDRLGAALTSDRLRGYAFMIAGHTDAVGDEAYNLDLSRRRARSVVDYLNRQFGIDSSRLQSEGYGESRLYDPSVPDSGVNRRVEIVNLGQASR